MRLAQYPTQWGKREERDMPISSYKYCLPQFQLFHPWRVTFSLNSETHKKANLLSRQNNQKNQTGRLHVFWKYLTWNLNNYYIYIISFGGLCINRKIQHINEKYMKNKMSINLKFKLKFKNTITERKKYLKGINVVFCFVFFLLILAPRASATKYHRLVGSEHQKFDSDYAWQKVSSGP